ncbi:MAG: antiporter, partial [Haliea sp.]
MSVNQDIDQWDPEDQAFWEREGKRVANRNLWISIPNLLCGFAVWLMWGIITVQMLNLGFPFEASELFTLTAIAGLTGATLRIPASFMIRIAGGRNTIFLTTALLIIPAFGAGLALQNLNTPLWVFMLLALLSGVGGGNFAASMSNISTFFPKRQQGLALGLNAGLGNFGVTTMQILIPAVMTVGLFGLIAGDSMTLVKDSGTLIGRIEAGTETWIQNAGFIWVAILIPLVIAAWFGMNNLRTITPDPGHPLAAFGSILGLYLIGFVTATVGLYFYLPAPVGLGLLNPWLAMILIIIATLVLMRVVPGKIGENSKRQFVIFKDKHTWSMTILYILTFGSFIGFSMALPLSITVIFGYTSLEVDGVAQRIANPNAPSALTYAWIGPFVGALIRPVGG